MRRSRKVKIIATIGPASSSEEMLKKLFEAGADVFRINMSHADLELMRTLVGRIRSVEEAVGRPIGILADLQGPKLRVGSFANGRQALKVGQTFTLDDNEEIGTSSRVYLPHPEILSSVEPGDRLLIDDGKLELKAVTCDGKSIVATVVAGTSISDRKGVSLPDTELPVGALTEKDRADLDAVLETGVDWVALSFIQRPDDLAEARKIARGRALLMSKIEKPQAVTRLSEIIELSDAGAWRPRRRDAARGGSRHPEAHHPRRAPRRQAGRGRDPDAGIDDHRAGTDARRGVGCVDRRLRGRRCHHAVG